MSKLLRRVLVGVLASVLAIVPGAYAQVHDESGATFGPPATTIIPLNPTNADVELVFTPVTPCRICDTRLFPDAGGCAKGLLSDGGFRDVTIAGLCGIPSDASAAAVNITAVPATVGSPGDLRAAPNPPGTLPPSSIINYQFENVANAANIKIGTGIRIFADGASTDFIVDVNGFYRHVTCQAGTVKAFGQCWETALRAATSVFSAAQACRLVGPPGRGRLGSGLQLRALQTLGILALAAPPGEWTDSVYVDSTVFSAMTIANTEGFATQTTLSSREYRCVFNTLP